MPGSSVEFIRYRCARLPGENVDIIGISVYGFHGAVAAVRNALEVVQ